MDALTELASLPIEECLVFGLMISVIILAYLFMIQPKGGTAQLLLGMLLLVTLGVMLTLRQIVGTPTEVIVEAFSKALVPLAISLLCCIAIGVVAALLNLVDYRVRQSK